MKKDKTNQVNYLTKSTENKKQKASSMPDIFNGPIISTTVRLLMPVLIGHALSIVQLFVDTFYVSMIDRTSTALISATGLIFPLILVFYSISMGIGAGVTSLVARGIGAKNEHVIESAADSALLLSIIIGLLTLVFGIVFGSRLINLFAGSQLTVETIKYAHQFFYSILPGISILLFVYMLGGLMGGEGLTKYIGRGWIVSNLANIILAPFFIFQLNMGVKGAGTAGSVSIAIVMIYYTSILFRGKTIVKIKWNIFKASFPLMKEIVRIGAPVCLMILSTNVAVILLNNLVSSISQAAMNSWTLVGRIDQIILIPAIALGSVTAPMIGQNYGRGIFHRVEKIFKAHILLIFFGCGTLVAIYMIFATEIFQAFSTVPEVVSGSVRQVYYTAFTWLAVSGIAVVNSSFNATGRALPALFITIVRVIVFTIPLSMLSVHTFNMGMTGIYISIMIANILSFFIAFFWGRSHLKGLHKNQPVIVA